MKVITIAGNCGKDAVTRRTQDGTAVTGFSVAVEDRSGGEKKTFWFDVSLWGTRGEKLAQYLTKGTKVVVTGDLTRRDHEGKTYLGVKADNVTLMGGGERRDEPEASAHGTDYGTSGLRREWGSSRGRNKDRLDDEIPF